MCSPRLRSSSPSPSPPPPRFQPHFPIPSRRWSLSISSPSPQSFPSSDCPSHIVIIPPGQSQTPNPVRNALSSSHCPATTALCPPEAAAGTAPRSSPTWPFPPSRVLSLRSRMDESSPRVLFTPSASPLLGPSVSSLLPFSRATPTSPSHCGQVRAFSLTPAPPGPPPPVASPATTLAANYGCRGLQLARKSILLGYHTSSTFALAMRVPAP